METILTLDYELFRYINGVWHHPFLDVFLDIFRNKYIWIPLYFFIILLCIFNLKKAWLYVLVMIITVSVADICSSHILKKNVKRLRPCNTALIKDTVRPVVGCSQSFSFTSSHAANHFSLAAIFSLLLPLAFKWKFLLYLWAATICYAQVYVGVHFPSDVFCGAVLGVCIAFIVFMSFKKFLTTSEASIA